MENKIIRFTIYGQPAVKKNSQQVVRRGGKIFKIDTPAYKRWRSSCEQQLKLEAIKKPLKPISEPINLELKFYLETRRKTDLSALYEGIQDVLVKEGWLEDDNYLIVANHDGSSAQWDKENPRIEVAIKKL